MDNVNTLYIERVDEENLITYVNLVFFLECNWIKIIVIIYQCIYDLYILLQNFEKKILLLIYNKTKA